MKADILALQNRLSKADKDLKLADEHKNAYKSELDEIEKKYRDEKYENDKA